MNAKLREWVDKIAQSNRGLAALLRGLVDVERSEGKLRFIWYSAFHKTTGGKRDIEIRQYLGGAIDWHIEHISLSDWAEEDPVLKEALELGARIKII